MTKVSSRARRSKAKPEFCAPSSALFGKGEFSSSVYSCIQFLLIVVSGLVIFSPALNGDWIGDDDLYILGNTLLNDPNRIWKAWFEPGTFVEYYPIHQTLQYLQWISWGKHPFGYHLTNVLLHITSGLLIWRILSQFGLRWAWLGGFFFVLHPILVESVCLINEFKNTLSLPPFLVAISLLVSHYEKESRTKYLLALLFFTIAMLCKISMATFPPIILLYAWWKKRSIGLRDIAIMMPFLVISLSLGYFTHYIGAVFASKGGAVGVHEVLGAHRSLASRIALVGLTWSFYFAKCWWPAVPLCIYPLWKVDPPSFYQFLPLPIMLGTAIFLWWKRASWGRHALLGLGYFTALILPFLGFNWISYMTATWVIDHLAYIATVGLIALAVAGLEDAAKKLSLYGRRILVACIALAALLMAIRSYTYAGDFINNDELSAYIIKHNPGAILPLNNLAVSLMKKGQIQESINLLNQAIAYKPSFSAGYTNLGDAYARLGDYPKAMSYFRRALAIEPTDAKSRLDLAQAYYETGDPEAGLQEFQKGLQLNPISAPLHFFYGKMLLDLKKNEEALTEYQTAVRLNPESSDYHTALGTTYLLLNRISEAMEAFSAALKLSPYDSMAHTNLGNALLRQGKPHEAMTQLEQALTLDPHNAAAHFNLATACALLQQNSRAINALQRCLEEDPNYPEAQEHLNELLAATGANSP